MLYYIILWTLTKRKLSIYVYYNSWTYDLYILAIWWGIGITCLSWVTRGLVGVFSILILIIVGWIPMFVGIFFTCFLLYQFDSCSHIFLIFPWVRFIFSQSYLCVLQPRLEGKFENKNGCLCTGYQCNGTHTYIPQNPEKLLNELNMYQDVGIRHQILFFLIL